MNKLHEFSSGAFETFPGISSVVEEVLGRLGKLNRDAWIVDATVDDFEKSTLSALARRFEMKTADARGISTGVNECISRSGAVLGNIACVVGSGPSIALPPVAVLPPEAVSSEYVPIFKWEGACVCVRTDLARRVGVKTIEIIEKKNAAQDE